MSAYTNLLCVSQCSCVPHRPLRRLITPRDSGSIIAPLIRSLMQAGSVENRVTYRIDTPMSGRDIPSACVCTHTALTDQYIPHPNQVPCRDRKSTGKARVHGNPSLDMVESRCIRCVKWNVLHQFDPRFVFWEMFLSCKDSLWKVDVLNFLIHAFYYYYYITIIHAACMTSY